MRLLIFTLILIGGMLGGAASGADYDTAAILGSIGVVMAFAGAWLLYDRVDRRRV